MPARDLRPPLLGRAILRAARLGDRRDDVEADLLEQFRERVNRDGRWHASRRYIADAVSVWKPSRRAQRSPERRWRRLDDLYRDIAFAIRIFGRRPGLTGLTLLGLGLATGMSTAIFTLVHAALTPPAGVTDPASVVQIRRIAGGAVESWTLDDYLRLEANLKGLTVESLVIEAASASTGDAGSVSRSVDLHAVSGGYLSTFGATPVLGRLLGSADADAAAPPVAVLSHGFWRRTLNGDPAIVGRTLTLGQTRVTVVGVVNREFIGTARRAPAMWVTWTTAQAVHPYLRDRGTGAGVQAFARLAPSVTWPMARAEIDALVSGAEFQRATDRGRVSTELGAPNVRAEDAATVVSLVYSALALVVLLAASNTANLLLAHASERRREIGVRIAIGAGRGRLARQLLTEGLVLGGAGAIAGALASLWIAPAIASVLQLPAGISIETGWRSYVFAIAVAGVVGGLAALAPIRYGIRGDIASPLKGASTSSAPFASRLRRTLVGVQAAASISQLVVVALLVRGVVSTRMTDLGFDADRIATVQPEVIGSCGEACLAAFATGAAERLRSDAGVEQVAFSEFPPIVGASYPLRAAISGELVTAYVDRTSPGFFETVGMRVQRGRIYTDAEAATGARVAVVSDWLARRIAVSDDVLGQSLAPFGKDLTDVRVIGVVNDAYRRVAPQARLSGIFLPADRTRPASLVVRTRGAADAEMVARLASIAAAVMPGVRPRVWALQSAVDVQLESIDATIAVAAAVSFVSLGLALVGLYGVTSFVVTQRARETGLRLALGATTGSVTRELARDSLRPVVIGLAIGLLLSLIAGQLLVSSVLGISSADPLALVSAALLLFTSAALAVVLPVRRAARIDPAIVLRQL